MTTRTSVGREFQDKLLERLRHRRQVTTLYLRNRMVLRGRILEFDPYVLLLQPLDGTPPVMVYKSALVSVSGPPPRGGRRGPRRPAREGQPARDGQPSRAPKPGSPRPGGPTGP